MADLPLSLTFSAQSPSTRNSLWRMVICRLCTGIWAKRIGPPSTPAKPTSFEIASVTGKTLDPFSLRPAGDGKLAKRAAEPGIVGADVSARLESGYRFGGLGNARHRPIRKGNPSGARSPSAESGQPIPVHCGRALYVPGSVRGGRRYLAAGSGAQTGNPRNADHSLLPGVF